nr:MAG TPA: hypothetical protein [Caudoviricetes sp.]
MNIIHYHQGRPLRDARPFRLPPCQGVWRVRRRRITH